MTVLRGITWDHPRGADCLVAASRDYASIRPDVKVRWEARSLAEFASAPLERLAREYDLLVVDHPHIPLAHHTGALAPLDDPSGGGRLLALAGQSVGPSHQSYTHDGRQYALAIDAAAQVAVYRPDLLPEPPRTWDEVFALADQGKVLWPGAPIDAFSSLLTLAANAGTPAGEPPGGFLPADAALPLLALLHRLAAAAPERCLEADPIDVAEMMSREDRFAYAPLVFGYSNYARAGFRPRRLRYVDLPAGPRGVAGSCLGGAGIAVSATTGALQEAQEFAFWLASAPVQTGVYYRSGGQPGNALAWADPDVNADSGGFFRDTSATLSAAWTRPRSASWPAFQNRAAPVVHAALTGKVSDRACIDQLNHIWPEA